VIKYPSFNGKHRSGSFYLFDKLDGSNVRAEWNRKHVKRDKATFGFNKFGKRNGLLDDQTPHLIKAKDLIIDLYAEQLCEIFSQKRLTRATAFFEFYGPNSSFGYHADEEHTVTLIDCHINNQGFMHPRDFVDWFKYVDHAELLHVGNVTEDLIRQIKDGTLPGMTFEGVVAKGDPERGDRPVMWKIKTNAWYEALRERVKDEKDPEAAFERLS
jgi:hypothetical protein